MRYRLNVSDFAASVKCQQLGWWVCNVYVEG